MSSSDIASNRAGPSWGVDGQRSGPPNSGVSALPSNYQKPRAASASQGQHQSTGKSYFGIPSPRAGNHASLLKLRKGPTSCGRRTGASASSYKPYTTVGYTHKRTPAHIRGFFIARGGGVSAGTRDSGDNRTECLLQVHKSTSWVSDDKLRNLKRRAPSLLPPSRENSLA